MWSRLFLTCVLQSKKIKPHTSNFIFANSLQYFIPLSLTLLMIAGALSHRQVNIFHLTGIMALAITFITFFLIIFGKNFNPFLVATESIPDIWVSCLIVSCYYFTAEVLCASNLLLLQSSPTNLSTAYMKSRIQSYSVIHITGRLCNSHLKYTAMCVFLH